MRWEGQRNLRLSAGKARAALRERINVRSVNLGVSVGAQVVRAQGVNGDQDDGDRRRIIRRRAGIQRSACGKHQTQQD